MALQIDLADLANLTAFIHAQFGVQDTVLHIQPVGTGANAGTHYVAITDLGNRFGLKVVSRGVQDGLSKEKLLADLAVLLTAPNASAVAQTDQIAYVTSLAGQMVNVIFWLANSQTIAQAQANIINDQQSLPFFSQLGEWISFGLAFGVVDRHTGNWVWNQPLHQLAMIDLEDSLGPSGLPDFNFVTQFLSGDANLRQQQIDQLRAGYANMQAKIQDQHQVVLGLLAHYPFAQAYVPRHNQFATDATINALVGIP